MRGCGVYKKSLARHTFDHREIPLCDLIDQSSTENGMVPMKDTWPRDINSYIVGMLSLRTSLCFYDFELISYFTVI